jgi:WD40 repeat protein
MQRLRTDPGYVYSLAYGPLGNWLCANAGHAPAQHRLHWWSLSTGREFEVGLVPRVTAGIAIARKSDLIAAGTPDGIGVYSFASGLRQVLPVPGGGHVSALEVSPDGNQVAFSRRLERPTEATRSHILIHRPATETRPLQLRSSLMIQDMDFSPDSPFLACAGSRGFTIWDLPGGESILAKTMFCGEGRIAFAPGGKEFAVTANEYVQVWGLTSGKQRQSLVGHQELVHCLAYSPDGKTLASGAFDRTTRFWNADTGELVRAYDWQIGPVHAVAFAPDGLTCAAGGESGEVVIWDVED